MKDINGCLDDITRMIVIQPKNQTLYFDRAYYKGMAKDIEGSISDYSKAIELNPKYKEAYANRGFAKINLLTTRGTIQPSNSPACAKPQELAETLFDSYPTLRILNKYDS